MLNAHPDILEPFDHHFALNLLKFSKTNSAALYWLLALVSKNATEGHAFLGLNQTNLFPEPAQQALNQQPGWLVALKKNSLVGSAKSFTPLVLVGHKLYLRRYWDYEQRLLAYFTAQSGQLAEIDESLLQQGLDQWFAEPGDAKQASENAVRYRLSVMVGGPGSGKTTAVLKILSLWFDQQNPNTEFRCALAAPTGKAALRMQHALSAGLQAHKSQLNPQLFKALAANAIPAKTIHRLLGRQRFSSHFSYNASRLLPLDALVVDESSMLDVSLLCKLTSALPKTTRLLLLGDQDQLPSVEVGSVLHDLCNQAQLNPLNQQITRLSGSYRFSPNSRIKQLSELCRQGQAKEAWNLLQKPPSNNNKSLNASPAENLNGNPNENLNGNPNENPNGNPNENPNAANHEIRLVPLPTQDQLKNVIYNALQPFFQKYEQTETAAEALKELQSTLWLCALRQGRYGVQEINRCIEQQFFKQSANQTFYPKKAVLVSRNAPELGLSNGDLGVCWPTKQGLAVFFDAPNGLQQHWPADLPACETAFALTVHKSQGSEFNQVHCLLPDNYSKVLTRELLYTAITRAREQFILYSNQAVFEQTVQAQVKRNSGLAEWNKHQLSA